MRAIIALFLLSVAACSAVPESDTALINVSPGLEGTNCSFKAHPKLSIFDPKPLMPGPGRSAKVGIWSDSAPVIETGPPATLSITFNRPNTRDAQPYKITLSIDPGAGELGFTSVTRGQIWVDGAPAPRGLTAFKLPESEGRVLTAEIDDKWNQRLLGAREAVVEAYDKSGKLLARYRWDLKPLAIARPLLDKVRWSCPS